MIRKFKITLATSSFVLLIFLSTFLDSALFFFVDLIKNPMLDFVMNWFTQIISTFMVLILVTSLFLWGERKREWIFPLWISFFLSVSVGYILKILIMRPRPFGVELSYFGFADYSFPSAHAIASFSVIAILDKEYRKIKLFWIAFAFLVAFSRIYINVHYFSDVVAGAIIGYWIGHIIMNVEEKHRFFKKKGVKH